MATGPEAARARRLPGGGPRSTRARRRRPSAARPRPGGTARPARGCGSSAEVRTFAPTWAPGAAGVATGSSGTWSSAATPATGGWRAPSGPARPTSVAGAAACQLGVGGAGGAGRAGRARRWSAPTSTARQEVWTDLAPKLYAQAAAGQWDPATAVDWTPPQLPDEVEAAVVQVMTYLVENEQAALDRAGPLHRADPPPLPGNDAVPRHPAGRRGPPRRGVHCAGPDSAGASSGSPGPVAGRRCRPCSTSRTGRSPPSCCRCWARGRFCRSCRSSSATRPIP